MLVRARARARADDQSNTPAAFGGLPGCPIPGIDPPVLSQQEVEVGKPNVQVQQHADGTVAIDDDAKNPFAPSGAELVGGP